MKIEAKALQARLLVSVAALALATVLGATLQVTF